MRLPGAAAVCEAPLKWWVIFTLLGSLSGCIAPKPAAHMLIEPACLTAPITLSECSFETEPPRCKQSKIQYRKGCERLVIGK